MVPCLSLESVVIVHELAFIQRRSVRAGSVRNGTSSKTVPTDDGLLRIEVPSDRESSF